MSYLGTQLRAKGFTVTDSPRQGRSAAWQSVRTIMVHHTAGNDSASAEQSGYDYVRNGGTYPPSAQLFLGQSGRVYVCSEERPGQKSPGRATHAGEGGPAWGMPADRANEYSLGIECHCNGQHALSTHATLYSELIQLIAALCQIYGLTEANVLGHKEWTPRKIDPRDSMAKIRADVKAALAHKPKPPPTQPPTQEEEMPVIMRRAPGGALAVTDGVTKFPIGPNSPNHYAKLFPGIRTVDTADWLFDAIPNVYDIQNRLVRYLDSKNSEALALLRSAYQTEHGEPPPAPFYYPKDHPDTGQRHEAQSQGGYEDTEPIEGRD